MALKKEDKIRLEGLETTFKMLVKNNIPESQVVSMITDQVGEFEVATNSKLKLIFGEDPYIELVDLSKDFVRTRISNEDNYVLRAKIEGVPIEVKTFKRDDFTLTNLEIASALRALADEVEVLDVELATLGNDDVRKLEKASLSETDLIPPHEDGEEESEDADEYEFLDSDPEEDSENL
jgi:hypothetical protein